MSFPDPFNKFHKIKHNLAITCQNQLDILDQKAKDEFSQESKNFGHKVNVLGFRPLIVTSLKEAWHRQSLIDLNRNMLQSCESRERHIEKTVLVHFLGPFGPTWELETKHKNGTARQLNYCCIESINGDMKKRREQIFTSTHFYTLTQNKKVDD